MPIAIYRHWKLNIALPCLLNPVVCNLTPWRMHNVHLRVMKDGSHQFTLDFTHIKRRLGLLINHDEIWQFHRGEFIIHTRTRRNDQLMRERMQVIPPAISMVWTDDGNRRPVYEQFEEELPARVIVERYLRQRVPNPDEYLVMVIDFNPKKMVNGRPVQSIHPLRTVAETELAATEDKSETADEWSRLFLE